MFSFQGGERRGSGRVARLLTQEGGGRREKDCKVADPGGLENAGGGGKVEGGLKK